MKDLSVIIVNYKGGEKLVRCLKSLQIIEDTRFSFEVIVVDNQSDDGSLPGLILQFPQFIFLINTGNNGFSNGCNLGASKSGGTNLLFLNPDTMVQADALFVMLEEIRVRPEFSIVSCGQIRENGSKERPYGQFLTIFTLTGWLRSVYRLFSGRMEDSVRRAGNFLYPDWVSGSVVMISRDSLMRMGKWDDEFWMYYEDVDLCRRARLLNGEVVLIENAVIVHTHGGSSRINKVTTVLTKTEVHISRHLYVSKHENKWRAFFMHFLLILNNMLLGLLPALMGFPLFFVKKPHVNSLVYIKLAGYYLNVLRSGRWISERSVKYKLYNP